MFLIPKMTEKNIAKTASWMDAASRIIVLTIPIIAYIWSSEFDRRFESLKDDLSGQFITKDEADQSFVARNRFIDSTSSTNEIISMHTADSDHHLSRAEVVTKDLYQSNRLSDRQQLSRIEERLQADGQKLDKLLEMVYAGQHTH